MFWGITADNWALLWSAIIGAIASAIAAVIVVWLSNKHQTKLSTEALAEQREQADRSLAEQKESLQLQLKEQRRQARRALNQQRNSLEKQLAEQRREASKDRLFTSLSDFIAAAETGISRYRDPAGPAEMSKNMHAALHRIGFDTDSKSLFWEIRQWPPLMLALIIDARDEDATRDVVTQGRGPAAERLSKIGGMLMESVSAWPRLEHRDFLIEDLRKAREYANNHVSKPILPEDLKFKPPW